MQNRSDLKGLILILSIKEHSSVDQLTSPLTQTVGEQAKECDAEACSVALEQREWTAEACSRNLIQWSKDGCSWVQWKSYWL